LTTFVGINKDQKIAFIAKNGTGKKTIYEHPERQRQTDTGKVVVQGNKDGFCHRCRICRMINH
jgi:ABC-type enterochelin transport system ATPase subunit